MANIRRSGNGDTPVLFDPFRIMNEMLSRDPLRSFEGGRMPEGIMQPAFEVKERDDAYIVEADVPGIDEKDLDVTLTGNRLTVSGKREAKHEERAEHCYTYERSYGSFSRSFTLPEGVDAEHIDADMDAGVLKITIPKSTQAKPKKISLKQRMKNALSS